MLVAIFSAIKVFAWTSTFYGGSIAITTPVLYVFTFIFLFVFGGMSGVAPGGQRFTASNAPLRLLIMLAYDTTADRISAGPAWIDSELYDIDAKADALKGQNPGTWTPAHIAARS